MNSVGMQAHKMCDKEEVSNYLSVSLHTAIAKKTKIQQRIYSKKCSPMTLLGLYESNEISRQIVLLNIRILNEK